MQNGVFIEQVERTTLLNLFEGIESALTAINGKLATQKATVFLTPNEVADQLKVSTVTVWSWTKKGLLKSYRIGNQVRYIEEEVIQAAKATGKGGQAQ